MKGDFSRISFDPAKHFSRVLMQQGRVTLDADCNEQTDIVLHMMRTLVRDLYGGYGGPPNSGFEINIGSGVANKIGDNFVKAATISAGHYYVNGILCECETALDYQSQQFYKPDPNLDPLLKLLAGGATGTSAVGVYLDVWERHVSWVEDINIREVALGAGAPDTCTRSQVVWQVKSIQANACADLANTFNGFMSTARMAASLKQVDPNANPCVIVSEAKYRGTENQLYRVEIHQGNVDDQGQNIIGKDGSDIQPTFKWSRDNGSIVTNLIRIEGNDLVVGNTRGFTGANWVELSDDTLDLQGKPGVIVKLDSVQNGRLTLAVRDPAKDEPIPPFNAQANPKVRRWDQADSDKVTLTHGAIPIPVYDRGIPPLFDLEDGIQVQFGRHGSVPPGANTLVPRYRTGDYWLIPARVATGDIDWPSTPGSDGDLLPPRGIKHQYAPLAIVTSANDSANQPTDCRVILNMQPYRVILNVQPESKAPIVPAMTAKGLTDPAGGAAVTPAAARIARPGAAEPRQPTAIAKKPAVKSKSVKAS